MSIRSGKKLKWNMANGNEEWVDPVTQKNIDTIYDFIEHKTLRAKANRKRKPRYSYNQISKQTGIIPQSVTTACKLLAYKLVPIFKLHAISYSTKDGGKISQKVELIRFVDKSETA